MADIRDDAANWVARMDAGVWSETQEAELQAWLAGDPRRSGALLQAQAAWMTLDHPPVAQARIEAAPSRWSRRGLIAGGVGMLAASLAGGFLWHNAGTTYETEVGEIRRVPLADGSSVAINTASRIDIRLAASRRDVTVEAGEAWFQVAPDPARPFVVAAGRVRVRAVGTAFAIRRRDRGADILVTEGVVEAWTDGAEGNKVRLTAGHRAFVTDNAAIIRPPGTPSSVDRALAWRAGRIDLVGDTLAQAAEEFNRYNRRRIVLVDPTIVGEQFDGLFRTDDPEGFAVAVSSSLSVPIDLSRPDEIRIGAPRR